jgi:hypothetical protein
MVNSTEAETKRQDRLERIFELRKEFMYQLNEKIPHSYDTWPIDLTKKSSQQMVRELSLRGVEEMFEAVQHLKNSKPHRLTDIPEIDREAFVEEIVDAFNFFFSVLILVGVNEDELYQAYEKKHQIILNRLNKNY